MNATPKAHHRITASFLVSTAVLTDPTLNTFIPRATRKTLRLPSKPTAPRFAQTDLTETFRRDAYKADEYFCQNLEYLDRGYDHDEFGDIDDEYAELTIVSPMGEAELFEFCTGYNVI